MEYAPTAFLYLLVILLSALLGVAGVALIQRLMPVQQREPHNTPIGILFGALYVLFGIIVGFTSYLALTNYNAARVTVQSEASDVARIYKLAQSFPESKREEIQGLAESYARVVVEEEWPLMRQGQSSPRAQALANELRIAIQEFKPATTVEQLIYTQELDAVNDLDRSRTTRLLDVRLHLPPVLWIALIGLSTNMLLFSCLIGVKDTRLHMLGVAALIAGIALVLLTIGILDRPFGTQWRVGPQPFELVLQEFEGTSPIVGGPPPSSVPGANYRS